MAFINKIASVDNIYKNNGNNNNNNNTNNKWYAGEYPTQREVFGHIYEVNQTDKEKANRIYTEYKAMESDPASPLYHKYAEPTNRARDYLASSGFNTNLLYNGWLNSAEADMYINSNLVYDGATNTPKAPGEKSTVDQYNAYWLKQYMDAQPKTQAAINEYNDIINRTIFLAQSNKNYSDQQIIEEIRGIGVDENGNRVITNDKLKQNYPTLYEMENSNKLLELNAGVDFSDDVIYAAAWYARNSDYAGDIEGAMAHSYVGDGNTYVENPEISALLNPKDPKFLPYAIGSTALDDEAYLLGQHIFTKEWIAANDGLQYEDSKRGKAFRKVLAAEDDTVAGENAITGLNEWIKNNKNKWKDPKEAKKALDRILANKMVRVNGQQYDLSILNRIDETIGKGEKLGTGNLIAFNRPINYKYDNVLNELYGYCEENAAKGNGDTFGAVVSNAATTKATSGAHAVKGVSDNDIDAVSSVAPIQKKTQQQMAVSEEQDNVLRNGAEAVEDIATPAEKTAMNNSWSVTFDYVKNVWETVKQVGVNINSELIQTAIKNSISKTASTALEGAETIASYELNQKKIDNLYVREQELQNTLGNLVNYGKDVSDFGEIYFDFDGNNIKLDLWYDEQNGAYAVKDMKNMTTDSENLSNLDSEKLHARIEGILKGVTDNRNNIIEANNTEISEEQQTLLDEYNQVSKELDSLSAEQKVNDGAYNEAINNRDQAEKLRNATIDMLLDAGASPEDLQDFENTSVVVSAIQDFTKYDPTEWEAYNAYDLYAREFLFDGNYTDVFYAAKEGDDKTLAEIETVTWMMDYADRMGIQIPDNIRNNMERYIAKLERNHQDYEYFALIGNDDFKDGAENGRQLLQDESQFDWEAYNETGSIQSQPLWDMFSDEQKQALLQEEQNYKNQYAGPEYMVNMYEDMAAGMGIEGRMFGLMMTENLLTDYEIDTYYYLLGTQGIEAAEQYYSHLADDYGVLSKRYSEVLEEGAADLADQGFLGRRAADVLSMILAPAAAIGSLAYGIEYGVKKLNGEDVEYNPNNPWLSFNTFRKSARDEINREIVEAYGEGTLLQKVASGLQEMVSNRGDSIMNAMAFGWLTNGISSAMLEEFTGALPMATSAAFDAMSEAKEKGANDAQLWAIGGVTLLAESITEAITLSNIKEAFGAGENITAQTIGDFLKDWFTKNGVEEMFGESVNDIVEYIADKNIMGDLSDHSQKVQEYIDSGLYKTKDEAEEAAWRDMMSGVLHTALISYLSPGLDIVSFGAGRLNYYRDQARNAQEHGANLSLIDVMRADKGIRERVDAEYESQTNVPEAQQTEQTSEAETEQTPVSTMEQIVVPGQEQNNVINAPEEVADTSVIETETTEKIIGQSAALDYAALDAALNADQSSQTATVASVLDVIGSEGSSDVAKAAAANIDTLTGGDMSNVEFVQDLMLGAYEGGVDVLLVKQAIQNAALSESSTAYQVMQTGEYINADLDQKAQMLAATVEADANNADVINEIGKSVHENRVATAEMGLILNGALKGTQKQQATLDEAEKVVADAQTSLDEKQKALDAALEDVDQKAQAVAENPTDDNMKQHADAVTIADNADESRKQYEQHLQNAEQDRARAEAELKRIRNEEMAAVRQQAEDIVAQEDQQRAERQAQEAEIAKQKAEQEVQQQIAQEEYDNAARADEDRFIADLNEKGYNLTPEEEQHVRDVFAQTRENPQQAARDENGQMTDEARNNRDKFVKQVSDKYGIQIDVVDTAAEDGMYSNGYYDRDNNRIVLDVNSTMDDAMYFVLGHELTHVAERSGTYTDLANALLRIAYGEYADYATAISNLEKNGGRPTTTLEADILHWKDKYDRQLKKEHSYEYALQELVADNMGVLINDQDDAKRQDLVNRLVSEEPSVARRILDSIKRFIKQAVGMKGAWLSNAQKTVDMFEAALKDAQNKSTQQNGEAKYSLGETTDGKWYVNVDTDQHIFDNLSPKQILLKADSIIKDRFKGLTVGLSDGDATVTKRTAEEYARPANKRLEDGIREVKGRASTELDNLLYASELMSPDDPDYPTTQYDKDHHPNVKRWSYFKTRFKVGPEQFTGIVNVARMQNFSRVHDITDIKQDTSWSALQEETSQGASTGVPEEMVPQPERVVKPDAEDSNGTALTGRMEDGTEVKNSLSSWTSDEIKKVRQNLLKNGFTQAEADKWIGDVNSIAAVIAADKDRLDFTPDRTQKFKKPNGDVYKWTLDASTLCAKRLLYQGTFNEIQKLLPNTPLYAGDLIELSNMMREMGYQTPCGICYVESQRRDTGKFTEEFLTKYSKEHEGEFIPTYADLTTSDGLYKLRDEHPEVYNAYIKANNARGSASTKPVQLRTDYRGDVRSLTADSVEYLNSIGGLRIQSFSDFETPHLMDMMQAVLDMTAKGLKSQAYTKVPNFAWVFGDTGIKINLSLMGEGTGVDENGNLIFSSTEGMDFDEAMKLRDRYSQNVGTILVGMNDAQILAAMADPRIDYIIPFHRSGWSEENRAKMTSLANYKDYQDYQNERDIKTGKKAESNLEPLGPDGYWDYNLTGKENAEKYLKLCAEKGLIPKFEQFLVNNGDGSYSLQPDGSTDGYWKTLIDIKMYDNDGNGAPQQVVNPNINMDEAYRVLNEFDGTGVSSLPVAQTVVDRYVEEYKAKHPIDEQSGKKYSLPSDKLLEQQIRQYLANGGSLSTATVPSGNNTIGTPGMRPQRQFGSQTAQTSNALHDEVKEYLLNHSSYDPDTNQAQVDRAMDWVKSMASENDPDGYYAALNRVTSDSFDYRSADGQARMLTVMSMAALKAEAGDRGALNDELRLADAFNKQGTDLGRQLQARKIFRLMTPVGRQSVLQGMCDDINEQLGRKGINADIMLSEETLKAAGEAQTEDDFTAVRQRAAKEIAEQMPSNWKDKLRGWRMLSMLGNPRTHIRNIVGNALFVPVVSMKNKLGALGEIITRQDQRTKTLSPVLPKEIRDFAKQDALTMKNTLTGEAKYNENNLVESEQKPFKGLLQAIIDFNSNMLEKEDWTFLKGHYKRALGGWMQANGYTAEQLQNDPTLLEQGRTYAIQEAQKATYRDFSKLASTLNKVSREGGVAGFISDAVLPFKKTPANILKRGIEYSPAGIMRSLTTDLYHLKQWNDYQNEKLKVMPDKAISPTQFIDRLCSGLSGTAIMAVGAFLSSAGIATCGLDDDEDKLEKEQGNQEYSFKFNIAGQDFTFTMDWAAPMSMPFFVGAAIQEQLSSQEGIDVESLVDAFGNITEPVFNLSMLDGVNSLFKTSQYDDTNTLTQIGAKIASNYGTSYVPSLMGAIARTIDDTRRKSFVEQGKGTGVLGTFRYAKEQVENKIPGLSQTNIPVRDVWGNADITGLAERILENFILPGYVNEYKNDPVLNEMARLYDATGDTSMIPKDPDKSVTYKKQKYVLTAEQWDLYKETRGQTAYNGLTELINTEDYQKANESTQAQMIKDVWSYADKVGKQAIIPDFEMENMGTNPVATITKESKITSYKADMIKALDIGDYEGYDAMVEALREEGVEDSAIKTKISDKYRDMYKDAYRKENYEEMARIEEILDNTGYSFDINAWEQKVDEKYGDTGSIRQPARFIASNGMSDVSYNSKPSRPASDDDWGQYMDKLDEYWRNYDFSRNDPVGQYGEGNIDMNNRKVIQNDDGSISTERSFSFWDDREQKEILIPLIVNGKVLTEEKAIQHYYDTGEYLGKFDDWKDADEYAMMLHNRGDWYYHQ